jgi:DNA processing protein
VLSRVEAGWQTLSDPGQTEDSRLDWLRLIRSENIGPRTFHDLVRHYGGVHPALLALPDLARRGGLKRSPRICSREQAEAELKAARAAGVEFLTLDEHDYPARLRMIDDPPPVLALRGNIDALARPLIGIVGSRNASAAGIKFAQRIARDLGDAGFTVVSGLARGIDAAAHRASLGTGTVAVLAGGHDRIYPAEHVALLEELLAEGAAISEMPFTWEPRAHTFRAAIASSRAFRLASWSSRQPAAPARSSRRDLQLNKDAKSSRCQGRR